MAVCRFTGTKPAPSPWNGCGPGGPPLLTGRATGPTAGPFRFGRDGLELEVLGVDPSRAERLRDAAVVAIEKSGPHDLAAERGDKRLAAFIASTTSG